MRLPIKHCETLRRLLRRSDPLGRSSDGPGSTAVSVSPLHWTLLFITALGGVGCSGSSAGQVSSARRGNGIQEQAREFLGVWSTDAGERAALLKFHAGTGGALHTGRQWRRICAFDTTDGGDLSFEVAARIGPQYTFTGSWREGKLRGQLAFRRGSQIVVQAPVVFHPIDDTASVRPMVRARSGSYSSIKYVEGAGDLSGETVLVVSLDGGPGVVYARAEGVMVGPYVGYDIVERQDTLRFRIGSPNARQPAIVAVFFGDEGVEVHHASGESSFLEKRFSISEFFGQEATGDCPPLG